VGFALWEPSDEPRVQSRQRDLLTRLAQLSPRQARVVELRVFVGMTVVEIAAALRVSIARPRSSRRDGGEPPWGIAATVSRARGVCEGCRGGRHGRDVPAYCRARR